MTSILIVDDNARVRTALRMCLQMHSSWHVCGEAEDGQDGVEVAQRLKPDVVLLDYAMPRMNGLEAARLISSSTPECRLILFTMFGSTELSNLAHAAGVAGCREFVGDLRRITAHLFNTLCDPRKVEYGLAAPTVSCPFHPLRKTTVAIPQIQPDGELLLRKNPARLRGRDANLLHCRSPFYLCFEHVDNLGAYTASRPETGLLIPPVFDI
jgi:CheY-like chemotaxis protein